MKEPSDEIIDQTDKGEGVPTTSNSPKSAGNKTEPDVIVLSERAEPANRDRLTRGGTTGPRTEIGKKRASRNAIKHGIFSDVTVLHGESRNKYAALLEGLRQALLPEGEGEELLVEKLASISWRYRRLLTAEGAEIRKATAFLEWDQQRRQEKEAEDASTSSSALEAFGETVGLIRKLQNPHVLQRCIELLVELRLGIKTDGFNRERDAAILDKIYGDRANLRETLRDSYATWVDTAEVDEEERQREGYATLEQCKQEVLNGIDAEIRRLRRYDKVRATLESDRTKLDILRRMVPDSPALDRLLRYEASLERSFDRSLAQLERLQRLRRGQPVAPRIDVNLTA